MKMFAGLMSRWMMPVECAASRASAIRGKIERGVEIQWPASIDVLQRHALEKFHGDEGLLFADFVDGADVGMVQRRSGFGFAPEALQRLGIVGYFIGKKFKRDEAVQARVFGLVDDAHAAATEFFEDAVVRDGLSDEGLRGRA